jgi:hypothetical protein
LIGTATVRSRRQSIVLGNIDNFLRNFDCSLRRSWEYVGCQQASLIIRLNIPIIHSQCSSP